MSPQSFQNVKLLENFLYVPEILIEFHKKNLNFSQKCSLMSYRLRHTYNMELLITLFLYLGSFSIFFCAQEKKRKNPS